MASAQPMPAVKSKGAASGGPMMLRTLLAEPWTEKAAVRSPSGIVRTIITIRAYVKNCPAALVSAMAV